jgi:hypothetical protein
MRPRKLLPRCQWDRGSSFGGFNETTEAASVVSRKPRKRILRFQWDRGSGFGGFNETVESFKKFQQHYFLPRKLVFSTKLRIKKFGFRSFKETAEADSAISMRPQKQIQRSQWDRGILCYTAEALVKTNIGSQFLLREIIAKKIHTYLAEIFDYEIADFVVSMTQSH